MGILGTYASGGSIPSAPVIGTAVNGSTSGVVDVAFTPSTYIGKGTITYTATSSPGGITATGSSSPISVPGLTNGTAYTFTVVGTTNYGVNSATTAASNSVTVENPSFWSLATVSYTTIATQYQFTSIPSTYKHLLLVHWGITNSANINDLYITTNGTSVSYGGYYGTSYTGAATGTANSATPNSMNIKNATTGTTASYSWMLIPNYSTSAVKSVLWGSGYDVSATGTNVTYSIGSSLLATAVTINTLTLNFSTAAVSAGGYQATLYGIRG